MSFYPLDDQKVVEYVRVILGNLTEDEISDEVILTFWHMAEAEYPDNQPLALYKTIYNIVNFNIIPQLIKVGAADGASLSEKEGSVTVTRVYGKTIEYWWLWLKEFEKHPLIPDLVDKDAALVIINGVRNDKYMEIALDANSRNGRAYLGMGRGATVRSRNSPFVMTNRLWFRRGN